MLQQDLAQERAAGEQLPTLSAIELQAQRFWKMGDMSAMQIRIAAPEVEMESLKMLGAPEFAGDVSLLERLAPVYQRVTQRALELAYGNDETSAENGAVLIDQVEGTS